MTYLEGKVNSVINRQGGLGECPFFQQKTMNVFTACIIGPVKQRLFSVKLQLFSYLSV